MPLFWQIDSLPLEGRNVPAESVFRPVAPRFVYHADDKLFIKG
jgi:hypothetical protein